MSKIELLSPAGTLKNMRYAFAYGADAVYAGQPRYSLRVRNNEFDQKNLALGIQEAHRQKKQFYVVLNVMPHNTKLETFLQDIKPVIDMQPDALIVADPGLIMLIRENFSEMPIHLSVQANVVNWASVKFWQQQGIQRIILSRELSLEEIEEICLKVPNMELEVFVHGALCMAYSGRCLLSSYLNRRDANQGACTNACRWSYNVYPGQETETGAIISQSPNDNKTNQQAYLIQEKNRPNDYLTAFEDQHGTYILNSKDLRAVQHVERLVNMGITSMKIEGRTKSFYYCARTAQVYRRAIDLALTNQPFDPNLLISLDSLANRGYTEGFLRRHSCCDDQNYYSGSSTYAQRFVGELTGYWRGDLAEVLVKNRFCREDKVELMTPKNNFFSHIAVMENKHGQKIDVAPGDGHTVYISLPKIVNTNYALLIKYPFSSPL